jgi:hypothetical protein
MSSGHRSPGIINPSSLESLVLLAGHVGGDNGRDLVEHFASHHPSERIRLAALRAQAAAAGSIDARLALYERAARGADPLVRGMAARELRRIEATRGWIEGGGPAVPAEAAA